MLNLGRQKRTPKLQLAVRVQYYSYTVTVRVSFTIHNQYEIRWYSRTSIIRGF